MSEFPPESAAAQIWWWCRKVVLGAWNFVKRATIVTWDKSRRWNRIDEVRLKLQLRAVRRYLRRQYRILRVFYKRTLRPIRKSARAKISANARFFTGMAWFSLITFFLAYLVYAGFKNATERIPLMPEWFKENWHWAAWATGTIAAVALVVWLVRFALKRTGRGASTATASTPAARAATTTSGDIVINFTGLLWSVVLLGVLGAAVIYRVEIRDYMSSWQTSRSATQGAAADAQAPSLLPADVALPIIAECESGGRQFDDDGNVIANPESSAVGKYQILEKLHQEELKKLGLDPRIERDNEQFARILYEREGTRPWNKSRGCWSTKLIASGKRPLPTEDVMYTIVMSQERPVSEIMPVGWRMDWWGNPEEFDSHVEWRGGNKIRHFAPKQGVEKTELRLRVYPCSTDAPC